jgi:hypothetical protein
MVGGVVQNTRKIFLRIRPQPQRIEVVRQQELSALVKLDLPLPVKRLLALPFR